MNKLLVEKQDELEKLQKLYYERNAEVERLKKELDRIISEANQDYDKGLVEGERRVLERVKAVLDIRFELWKPSGASENRSECVFRRLEISDIYNALGFGEDNETSDNGSYANKEEKA